MGCGLVGDHRPSNVSANATLRPTVANGNPVEIYRLHAFHASWLNS